MITLTGMIGKVVFDEVDHIQPGSESLAADFSLWDGLIERHCLL